MVSVACGGIISFTSTSDTSSTKTQRENK
jgi:hypothetical protein